MANNALNNTLKDLQGLNFILTRFNPKAKKYDDLDVLVHTEDFEECIRKLEKSGYIQSSHDKALGGRISKMQINLTRPERVKIDLHRDFTWRKKRYLDVEKIWLNSTQNRVNSTWDAFLVMINVIFEKTYFMPDDYEMFHTQWQLIKNSEEFMYQVNLYGWKNTFHTFKNWIDNQPAEDKKFPLFLPVKLVLFSYFEKYNFISLIYYLFFRLRFMINRRLPYETIS